MPYKSAFYAIIAVILAQIIALLTDLYGRFPSFDIPMHLGGGVAMGMLALAIHHQMTNVSHNRGHLLHHLLFVLGFTMLVAVAWEFHEYVLDETIGRWNSWPKMQLSLSDTMGDLFNGLAGAAVAFWIWRKKV